ncbi:MAG: hypothetical protein JXR63_07705 [Spirochaetales bacterium]|nr:hypothetical protein [Spirochaetales bacterium]
MKEILKLNEITIEESNLVASCNRSILGVKEGIMKKDYKSLTSLLVQLQSKSDEIERLDSKRDAAFKDLQSALGLESVGFFDTIVKLPADLRDTASESFRKLKLNISKFRSEMWIIENMLNTVQGMLNYVVKESQSVGESGCYSKNIGIYNSSTASTRPVVLNHTI